MAHPPLITLEAFNRLPKWAQEQIEWRNRRIDALEQEAAIMRGMHPDSPTSISLVSMDPNISLPIWTGLELQNPAIRRFSALHASLDRYHWEHGKRVIITVRTTEGTRIIVRPEAANVVTIEAGII